MSIPNIITILRIALIPVFVSFLFSGNYEMTFVILLLSGITDVLDGYIARKYNMITRLGTILDPAADKLMQFTVFLCLYVTHLIPSWLVVLLFVKEITMAIGTFILLKKHIVIKANASGKIATVVFYTTALVVFILGLKFPQMEALASVATALACIAVCSAFYAMFSYVNIFFKKLKESKVQEENNE